MNQKEGEERIESTESINIGINDNPNISSSPEHENETKKDDNVEVLSSEREKDEGKLQEEVSEASQKLQNQSTNSSSQSLEAQSAIEVSNEDDNLLRKTDSYVSLTRQISRMRCVRKAHGSRSCSESSTRSASEAESLDRQAGATTKRDDLQHSVDIAHRKAEKCNSKRIAAGERRQALYRSMGRAAKRDVSGMVMTERLRDLVELTEECFVVRDACNELFIDLEFFETDVETRFSKLEAKRESILHESSPATVGFRASDIQVTSELNETNAINNYVNAKTSHFNSKLQELDDFFEDMTPFDSNSYNDAITSYKRVKDKWAAIARKLQNMGLDFGKDYEIVNKFHQKLGEIEFFVSKNENFLKEINLTEITNEAICTSYEDMIKAMKKKIELFEIEIASLQKMLQRIQSISNSKLRSQFEVCTKTLNRFKHTISTQEQNLLMAITDMDKSGNLDSLIIDIDNIEQRLDALVPISEAYQIQSFQYTISFLEQKIDDNQSILRVFSENTLIDRNSFTQLEARYSSAETRLKSLRIELDKFLNFERHSQESGAFLNSLKVIKDQIRLILPCKTVEDAESNIRKLEVLRSEFLYRKERIDSFLNDVKLMEHNDTTNVVAIRFLSEMNERVSKLEEYMKELLEFIDSNLGEMVQYVSFFKFAIQSKILISQLSESNATNEKISLKKIFKKPKYYQIYCDKIQIMDDLHTHNYNNVVLIYDKLLSGQLCDSDKSTLKEFKKEMDEIFQRFKKSSKYLLSCINSVGEYKEFIDESNFMNHLFEIKHLLGLWILEQQEDHKAYHRLKFLEAVNELEVRYNSLKVKSETFIKDEMFDNYLKCNLGELQKKLEKLITIGNEISNKRNNESQILAVETEIDFITKWIDVVADNISFTNPKIVSYTWQLGDKIAISELNLMKIFINNVESKMKTSFNDLPECLSSKFNSMRSKYNSTLNIANTNKMTEFYELFLKIKSIDMQLEIFESSILKPLDQCNLPVKCDVEYFDVLSKVHNDIKHEVIEISHHFSNSETITSPFYLILNDAQECLLINNKKIDVLFKKIGLQISEATESKNFTMIFNNIHLKARIASEMVNSFFIDKIIDNPIDLLVSELKDVDDLQILINNIMDDYKIVEESFNNYKVQGCRTKLCIDAERHENPNNILQIINRSILKLNDYRKQVDNRISYAKSQQDLVLINIWISFHSKSKILECEHWEDNPNYHKGFLLLLKEINEKKIELSQISTHDSNHLLDLSKTCELKFDKIYRRIDLIYEKIGPNFHLEDLDTRVNSIKLWSCNFENKLRSSDMPLELKTFEAELLTSSCQNFSKELKMYEDKINDNFSIRRKFDTINKVCDEINEQNLLIEELILKEKKEQKTIEIGSKLQKVSLDLKGILEIKTEVLDVHKDPSEVLQHKQLKIAQKFSELDDIKQHLSSIKTETSDLDKINIKYECPKINTVKSDISTVETTIEENIEDLNKKLVLYKNDLKAKKMIDDYEYSLCKIQEINKPDIKAIDPIEIQFRIEKLKLIKNNLNEFIIDNKISENSAIIKENLSDKAISVIKSAEECHKTMVMEKELIEAKNEVNEIENIVLESKTLSDVSDEPKIKNIEGFCDLETQKCFIGEMESYVNNVYNQVNIDNAYDSQENLNKIQVEISDRCKTISSTLQEFSDTIRIHENDVKKEEKLHETITVLTYISEVCVHIQKSLDSLNKYEFLPKNLPRVLSINKIIIGNIKETIIKVNEYENSEHFDPNNEYYKKISTSIREFESISNEISHRCKILDESAQKLEESHMYIQWMQEKKGQFSACKCGVNNNDPNPDTIAIITSIETFMYSEDHIKSLLAWFQDIKLHPSDKKMMKLVSKQTSCLEKQFNEFHTMISEIKINSSASELIVKLETLHDTLFNISNGISFHAISYQTQKNNDPESLYGHIGESTTQITSELNYLQLIINICEKKLCLGKDELELFNSRISGMSLTSENKNKKENCLSKFSNTLSKLEQELGCFRRQEHRLQYVFECKIWYGQIKQLDNKISELYARLLNSFSSIESFKTPLFSFSMLKLDFQCILESFRVIGIEYQDIMSKKLANHSSYCRDKEFCFLQKVNEAKKSLENLALNYKSDLENFISKVENSKYARQTLNTNEINFITMSSKFATLVDYAELCMTKDLRNYSPWTYQHMYENESLISDNIEKAEKMLDSLNTLNQFVDNSDWILSTPIGYSALEKQFVDLVEQFKNYKSHVAKFAAISKEISAQSLKYSEKAFDVKLEFDIMYKNLTNSLLDSNLVLEDSREDLSTYQRKLVDVESTVTDLEKQWNQLINLNHDLSNQFQINDFKSMVVPSLNYDLIFDRFIGLKNSIFSLKEQIKSVDSYNLLDSQLVRELTMMFFHLDINKDGYLNLDGVIMCMRNVGIFEEFVKIYDNEDNLILKMRETLVDENCEYEQIFLKSFLEFVGKEYSPVFQNKEEILNAFEEISGAKSTIRAEDLKNALTPEAANFWIQTFSNGDQGENQQLEFDYQKFFITENR